MGYATRYLMHCRTGTIGIQTAQFRGRVVLPVQNTTAMKTIVLDPGHGGHDPGAVGNGLIEKELNLDIARRVRDHLASCDCDVQLTRSDDTFLPLHRRAEIGRLSDLFLSIHINAHASQARGFETFVRRDAEKASREVQALVHSAIMEVLPGVPDRGRKQMNFAVLRDSPPAPAVLIEYLFISSRPDAVLLADERIVDQMAEATATAIRSFLKLPVRPASPWAPPVGKFAARDLDRIAGPIERGVRPEIRVDPS
jgi:N-acetylmuramoyl-L-alanine amidase